MVLHDGESIGMTTWLTLLALIFGGPIHISAVLAMMANYPSPDCCKGAEVA